MAYVKLKDGKVIKMERARAEKVQNHFEDDKFRPDAVLTYENQSFVKSMIAYVSVYDEDDLNTEKKQGHVEQMKDLKKRQFDEFENLLVLSPEYRALDTRYFKIFFKALLDREPNEQELLIAIQLQEAYFMEHDEPIANMSIFLDIIHQGHPEPYYSGFMKIIVDRLMDVWVMGRNYVRRSDYAKQKQLELHA
jgi:hypothetical protein